MTTAGWLLAEGLLHRARKLRVHGKGEGKAGMGTYFGSHFEKEEDGLWGFVSGERERKKKKEKRGRKEEERGERNVQRWRNGRRVCCRRLKGEWEEGVEVGRGSGVERAGNVNSLYFSQVFFWEFI